MTLHVVYTHECGSCGAYYIPYDQIPCPRCGTIEADRFDFIPQVVQSMEFNRRRYGTYTPDGWWVGSLGDHILFLLFQLFDSFGASDEPDFAQFSKKYLTGVQWGDQQYLRDHVEEIALRVREKLLIGADTAPTWRVKLTRIMRRLT